jgi:recombination protein RecT
MNEIATQENRGMAPYMKAIIEAQPKFSKQSYSGLMNFDEEAGHAVEILMQNKFALKTAQQNPQSVQRAVIKVAAIGLTLNRALSYAYLVPRDNQICLDISYKGLVKLATDSGAIKWAKAELVRANDEFEFNGIASEPTHKMNPFAERGEIVGVYCVAKTADGDFLTDVMSMDDIKEVQATSKASNGPWKTFFGEMAKKTVIKRAQKQWPKGNDNRLENAIQHLNEHEGLEPSGDEVDPDSLVVTGELIEPFFNAYFNDNALLMAEVSQRANENQWPQLCQMFSPVGKQLTVKKQKALELMRSGLATWRDVVEEYKEHKANDDELGIKQLIDDLPEYWQNRLKEVEL